VRRIRPFAAVAVLGVSVTSATCVSSHAGTHEAREILNARLGARPASDDDDAADESVAGLLAKPLSAENAVKIALLRNPDVKAAFARIGIARGDLIGASHLPNPTLQGDLRFRPGRPAPDADIGGVLDLRDVILLPLRRKSAVDDLDAASIEAAGLTMDIALHVRAAYVDYIAIRQMLELEESVVSAFDASAELAKKLREAGNTPELSRLVDEGNYQEALLDVEQAKADAIAARIRLNLRMGLSGKEADAWDADVRLLDPPDEEIPLADVESKSIAASLDLAELRARYAAASGRVDLAVVGGILPSLEVGVLAERDPESWGVGPQVGLGIPLFYQGEGETVSARAEMKVAEATALATTGEIRARAKSLASALNTARERALLYKTTLLPLRKQIVDQSQLQYNAMGASAFQLLQAKRDEVQSAQGYVSALRMYWATRGELEMLLAGRMADESVEGMSLTWQTLRSREMPHR